MENVRIGIVGLGMGRSRARDVAETAGIVVEAVCDIDRERTDEAAAEHGCTGYCEFDEMLEHKGLEAVYVLTPSGMHLETVEKAAQAGKHVIVTKPMEITAERSQRMIDICRDAGVSLIVDFRRRYTPRLQQWKAAIDAGEFGDIVYAEARCKWWRSPAYYEGWHGTWALDGGGSLMNQGIHVLDQLLWLCGDCEVVAAQSGAAAHDIETEDFTSVLLTLGNGNPALVTTTTNCHFNDEFGVCVSGTKGSGSDISGDARFAFEENGHEDLETPVPDLPAHAAADMVRVLRKGTDPYVPGEEGIRSVRIIEEIYRKAGIRGKR